jgi:positive regulator of sigma E activity
MAMLEFRTPELISAALYVATALLFLAAWAADGVTARRLATHCGMVLGVAAAVTMLASYTGHLEVWLDLPPYVSHVGATAR